MPRKSRLDIIKERIGGTDWKYSHKEKCWISNSLNSIIIRKKECTCWVFKETMKKCHCRYFYFIRNLTTNEIKKINIDDPKIYKLNGVYSSCTN